MAYTGRFGQSDDFRRDELIRIIEHSVDKLTLAELEALYYDLSPTPPVFQHFDLIAGEVGQGCD